MSCSRSRWCAALTIDSAECTFNFASCNPNCEEPVNFSYLQTNGIPPGPPAPQDPSTKTLLGNARTLKMNPGDVLRVSISDPPGGFTTKVQDLTTGQTGYIQASAKNGFTDTNMSDCSGSPFTWHAEYSTAKKQNQVPWAALEGANGIWVARGHLGAGPFNIRITDTRGHRVVIARVTLRPGRVIRTRTWMYAHGKRQAG